MRKKLLTSIDELFSLLKTEIENAIAEYKEKVIELEKRKQELIERKRELEESLGGGE